MSIAVRTDAKFIGKKDATTAEKIVAIRKAWLKAKTPEAQQEIRRDFHIGYIAGRDRVSISEAEAIVDAGKGADAINAPAIVRAVAAWHDQVMKGVVNKPEQAVKRMRLSAEARKAAEAYLSWFNSVDDAIKALRAVAPKK